MYRKLYKVHYAHFRPVLLEELYLYFLFHFWSNLVRVWTVIVSGELPDAELVHLLGLLLQLVLLASINLNIGPPYLRFTSIYSDNVSYERK